MILLMRISYLRTLCLLEERSDTPSRSEPDLTSTSNSKSASDYMPAEDLQSEELPALPMPTTPLKVRMEQVVQKQIPINH